MKRMLIVVAALVAALVPGAHASAAVGTSFPAGFPVITDASLGTPVIGFGAAGPLEHTPVTFLHGNNNTIQLGRGLPLKHSETVRYEEL